MRGVVRLSGLARTRRAAAVRAALALAAAAALLLGPACSGGGGGGGGPTQPPPPQQGITFTPSGGAGADAIALARIGQGATRLSLEVRAVSVTDLYGCAFDLRFPAALDFDGFEEGGFLDGGGTFDTAVQVFESSPGNLVVGATRLGAVGGATGSGTVLVLHFDAVASGNGPIAFEDERAFDPEGALSLQWLGGTVQVVL